MGYVNKGDRMANFVFYQPSHMEVNKETLFPSVWPGHSEQLLFFSSLGGKKISHGDFRDTLLGNLLAHERIVQRPIGRPPAAATQVIRYGDRGRKHWPNSSATQRRCRVCAGKFVTRNVSMICERCDVALCCDRSCFKDYHNKSDHWNILGCSTGSPYVKLPPHVEM